VTQTGGKVGAAVDDTGQAVGGVVQDVGAGAGQAAGQLTDQVGQAAGQAGRAGAQATGQAAQLAGDATGAAQDAGQQRRPASRRTREGETKRGSKRGSRRSQSSDDDGQRGRVVRSAAKVGHIAQQTLGRLTPGGAGQAAGEATEQVGQAAGAAVQQVGQAAGAAVEQVGQAAAKATEQVGQAAVEASGKASWTPSKARDAGQQRRPASRRTGEGKAKRGTRSRSSDGDGS
jgi:hypothetical protein